METDKSNGRKNERGLRDRISLLIGNENMKLSDRGRFKRGEELVKGNADDTHIKYMTQVFKVQHRQVRS